jgi:Ca2+-binding EF-hand superfamily protein
VNPDIHQPTDAAYAEAKAASVADSLSRFEGESGGAADSISIMNFGLALIQIGGGALPKDEVTALLNDDERKRQSNNAAERVVANGMVQWRRLLPRLVEMLLAADERRWRACFDKWDRNHDGRLTIRELEAAMASLGRVGSSSTATAEGGAAARAWARAEVEDMLRAADVNLDAALSFAEFRTVMKLAGVLDR